MWKLLSKAFGPSLFIFLIVDQWFQGGITMSIFHHYPYGIQRHQAIWRLVTAVSAVIFAILLVGAKPAVAKPYTQVLCIDPNTRKSVGNGSMPDGMSYTGTSSIWLAQANCGSNPTGVSFFPGIARNVDPGFWAALTYRPADNTTYVGAFFYRSLVTNPADAYGSLGVNTHAGTNIQDVYATPRTHADAGDWFAGGMQRGTTLIPFSPGNRVNLNVNDANPNAGFTITAACIPNGPPQCPITNNHFVYTIYGGRVSLDDSHDPDASSVSGGLITNGILKGTEDLSFSARDEGSGLRNVELQIDGKTFLDQPINDNGGRCVDIDPSVPAPEYAYRVPCKLSASKRFEVDTTQLPEGEHTFRVVLYDAAGNDDSVMSRNRIYVDNVPGVADPPGASGTTKEGQGGANPAGGGTKLVNVQELVDRFGPMTNGVHSSPNAKIVAGFTKAMKTRRITTFKAAKTVEGKLINTETNEPIGNALVDIRALLPLKGAQDTDVDIVKTKEDGTFQFTLPAGVSSRKLSFIYRPWLNQTYEAARSEVDLAVKAGLTLKVNPRKSAVGKKIFFSGKLLGGPFPDRGKQIVLQARSAGSGWLTFRVLRTKKNGTFRTAYRFKQPGRITYKFRALSRYEAAYPYLLGYSPSVKVKKQR